MRTAGDADDVLHTFEFFYADGHQPAVKIKIQPVAVLVKEATALGGAIAAGVGLYDSMADAADMLIRWEWYYEPDTQNHHFVNKGGIP